MGGLLSRNKGKRGEREAVALLKSLGFGDARRTAQASGKDAADVICPASLPGLHIESKYGYPRTTLHVGSSVWSAACEQAERDAAGAVWVVLWRPSGCRQWSATAASTDGDYAVTVSEAAIKPFLLHLAASAPLFRQR